MVKTRLKNPFKGLQRSWLTTTDRPPEPEGRVRTVFPSSEVAHRWASNLNWEGYNAGTKNFYFYQGTIFSYGSHFPIARHVITRKGERIILFTTRSYSSTTAGHKCDVRRAIPKDVPVFHVHGVYADTKAEHRDNLKRIEEEALELVKQAGRARSRKSLLLNEALGLIQSGNAYAEAVGLKERISSPGEGDLASWAANIQEEARIALERANAKAEARQRKELKEWELRLKDWQEGKEVDYRSVARDPRTDHCFVRVSRGKYLQTSLGMTIPMAEVMPVLETLRQSAVPQAFKEGEKVVTGGFQIQDWEGTIVWHEKVFQIGCHTIDFAEIERAASAAGL